MVVITIYSVTRAISRRALVAVLAGSALVTQSFLQFAQLGIIVLVALRLASNVLTLQTRTAQ